MTLQINKTYLIAFIFLFLVEILIVTFLKSGFIRFTFGDYLVVILIYCLVKSFFDFNATKTVIGVLIFSYCIEFLQLIKLIEILNLQNSTIAQLIFGSTFQISDLLAYTLGAVTIIIIEYKNKLSWI